MSAKLTAGVRDDVMRVQIKQTVKEHFEKELRISEALPDGRADRKCCRCSSSTGWPTTTTRMAKSGDWFAEAYKELCDAAAVSRR